MASINRVFILGRLGQDPEVRYTQNQTPVVTLNVATSESWTKDGQKQETTEWHRIIVWNRQAENCAKYLTKGRAVFVEGKIQTRQWDDKTGQKRYTTEIVAQNVQFLPNASGQNPSMGGFSPSMGSDQQSGGYQNSHSYDQFPQAESSNNRYSPPSSSDHGNSMGDLDDIPF
jgi:single-strand DNA-binding protein